MCTLNLDVEKQKINFNGFWPKEEFNSDEFHSNFSSSQILTEIQVSSKFEHENLTV